MPSSIGMVALLGRGRRVLAVTVSVRVNYRVTKG
jgi:hypothetical protein